MLELSNVNIVRNNKNILKGINLRIGFTERVVLTGANGSGKTHLGLVLSGLLHPTEGTYILDGKNVKEYDAKTLRKTVGIVFQEPEMQFITMSVEREILFGMQNIGISFDEIMAKAEKVKGMFGIEDLWDKSPYQLSGGEKQMVAIASIVAMEPSFIVFDEVTTFLDRKYREKVYGIVNNLNCGFLWITQDREEIRMGKRLLVLEGGGIVFDGEVEPILNSLEVDIPSINLKRRLIEEGLEEFL